MAMFSDSALPILNGVSVSIDCLIRELRAQGHSVHLFTSDYPGHKETDPNTHRVFALNTPFARDYPLALPPFYPYLFEFRKHHFDVIHTHTPFTVGFVGMRWAQSHEIPLVTTYHTQYDKYCHYIPFFPKWYLNFKIAKHTHFYYNQAREVITPSEASAHWLGRHSVRRPISVIPTGVSAPKELSTAAVRRQFGLDPRQKVMLYTGRIAIEKNLDLLIRAAAQVMKQNAEAILWIVGDGPGREHFRKLACDLGIGDRVTFHGFIPRADLDPYYAAADVFAFPSLTETQGLVIIEAMSYGLPSVVAEIGGAGAAVRDNDNGFLVPNEPGVMADKMIQVLSDQALYARLSESARQTAMKYSIPAMAQQVADVYRRAIGPDLHGGLNLAN